MSYHEPAAAPIAARPDLAALSALARKYRALAELRRARARGEAPPERAVFRSLAGEFPGALRELDTVRLCDLDARAVEIECAVRDDARSYQPWMGWMHGYHQWMRAALMAKIRTARHGAPDRDRAVRIADELAVRTGLALTPEFVLACASPPAGRLRPLVLARVAADHGATLEEIHAALFPPRRAGPDDSAV